MIHPFQVTKGVMMRGTDEASGSLFSYVELEARVPELCRKMGDGA